MANVVWEISVPQICIDLQDWENRTCPRKLPLNLFQTSKNGHRLFMNGWETRSRDVWKLVSNRTPGIISKMCKLGGGTPTLLKPVGTLQDFTWLDLGKNDSSSIK